MKNVPESLPESAAQISSLLEQYDKAEKSGGESVVVSPGGDASDSFQVNPQLDAAFHELSVLAAALQRDSFFELVRRFPSLLHAEGLDPLDDERLERWFHEAPSPAAEHAGKFVLSLLRNDESLFDLRRAFEVWDAEHRQAYVAWVMRPVVPQTHLWGAS